MKTILVVEDDTRLGRLFTTNLHARGYNTLLADDLTTARQNINEHCPDLIILDILLGEENGLELAHELSRHHQLKNTPIIVASASVPDIQQSQFLPNILSRLPKPFDVRMLLNTVSELI